MHENTDAASGFHRRLVVRDDNGNALFGFSFGMNPEADPNASPFTDNFSKSGAQPRPGARAGNGEVYIDMLDAATKTVNVLRTTPAEDKLMVNYMKSRIGDTAPYNACTNSCRTFTAAEYGKMQNEILRARTEGRSPKF